MILPKEEVQRILNELKTIKGPAIWTDIHVCPYEVIFNSFEYFPNPYEKGIYSLASVPYKPPEVGPLILKPHPVEKKIRRTVKKDLTYSRLIYKKYFTHIGPKFFIDQMQLSGIDRCLLLPVFQPQSDGRAEMDFIHRLYWQEKRFYLGYCVPNKIKNEEIINDLNRAILSFGIKAIKFNANIAEINLSQEEGRERLDTIIRAAAVFELPVIIHGGKSEILKNSEASDYSSLENLARTSIRTARTPIIISHAGLFGASLEEIGTRLLPLLKEILSENENIMVSVSGLETPVLESLLREVSTDRILFGSDFPYFSQWGAIIKLWMVLKKISNDPLTTFQKIVSENSKRLWAGG